MGEFTRAGPGGLLRQVASYGVIGVTSAALDAGVFWLLVAQSQVPPQVANVVSVSCGITLSFSLNRVFTFDRRDHTISRFVVFALVGLVGIALSAAILAGGMHLGLAPLAAKGLSIVVVAAVQFTLNRQVTFSNRGA
jgi:putative flippase GtrA